MSHTRQPIRRALLSVFYKDGVVDLARSLVEHGAELLSTGGTMRAIADAGLPVTEVAEYTGFPEMMDGRVKTLHPKIHGGLLGRRDDASHVSAMEEHEIGPIDLVCVNLYPFEETVATGGTPEQIIEKIDIGGPSMLRSAAKNHESVAVVCDPDDYEEIIEAVSSGGTTMEQRRLLARKVFERTGAYDTAIGAWFAGEQGGEEWPETLTLQAKKVADLRYGENPHQSAAVYAEGSWGLGTAEVLPGGKELSYNNYLDLDGAIGCVADLPSPAAVVVKHTNPCGAAVCDTPAQALERGWAGDPLSAFGSVIALNAPFDEDCAAVLCTGQKFVEAIAAPSFTDEAVQQLRNGPKWGKNVRLVAVGDIDTVGARGGVRVRHMAGGILAQRADKAHSFTAEMTAAGAVPIPEGRHGDLQLAQTLVKHLKSNAVCLVNDGMLVGAGAGQMSRVDSAKIAVEKAGDRAAGSVAGSDAFFPFPDGVEALAGGGVCAVAQPGGSMRDDAVTAAADSLSVAMVHTGTRHFRH